MSIFKEQIPETFLGREQLCSDLEKILSVINNGVTVTHMDTAERMLANLGKKWKLNEKNYVNPVYQALWDRIFIKRNEMLALDIEFAHTSIIKPLD